MKRLAQAAILLSIALLSPVGAGEFRVNDRTFVLPKGFEIEMIAGPPLVDRPIVADFDEKGRLYVADSSGSNDKVQKQLEEKPHRIVRLEDTDGDGRFDRSIVFADRMMFPEGAMWFDGSLYVSAPPSIWKLTDTDGDGVADKRVEWFQGKTLTGCANDLHGPYAGPDGWIYWCKGAFAQQTYERPGKPPFVTRASHIFRCRPDGSGIEPVMTGGMDNPVDVVFTPGGERIFSTTFLQHPGGGRRDGLIHAIYGGVYGKVHDVLDGHKRTSPDVMPVLSHLGPAAPCGLTAYESGVFGEEYRDNLFACCFNLQKVTRHILRAEGATFVSTDHDFLVSPDRDFHPTDVLEDADGSLVVIDTGGWYKLCCPTSQLHKPDVLGAIYRVKKKGIPKIEDPRGLKEGWSRFDFDPLPLLNDPRLAVQKRAIQAIARQRHGNDSTTLAMLIWPWKISDQPQGRRNAVWAATRIANPRAREAAVHALTDRDPSVRQVALHSISLWRDADAVRGLLQVLQGDDPQNRRAAAEALGRIGDKLVIPNLLDALGEPCDRALEHSLTFALIELAYPAATRVGLESPNNRVKRAALIALDQMDEGGLKPGDVVPALEANDPALKETALWIVGHHPEWGDALAGFLHDRLAAPELSAEDRAELEGELARFARSKSIQELLADRLDDANVPRERRLVVLRAMAQSGLKDVPKPWIAGLARVVSGGDADLSSQAVATLRALSVPASSAGELRPALLALAGREGTPAGARLDALAAVPGGLVDVSPEVFAFLTDRLDPEQPVLLRTTAADVLAKAKLTREQLSALSDRLKSTGPLEVDRLLTAFGTTNDEKIGLELIAALKQSPARGALRVETLKPRLAKFGPRVQESAEALYASLNEGTAQQRARLEELLTALARGDVRRGQSVFNSPRAACVSCHAIGYLGGKVGPDLTRIGQIRTERDLLEAIVFPSASFVRSFEPIIVATREGKVYQGVPRKDSADEIVLATGPTEEVRVARGEIEEIRPGTVSVMPAGLEQQLTPQEMADLVAFLRACR
jgi:putative membrane-bound dehydrogenase-like protein